MFKWGFSDSPYMAIYTDTMKVFPVNLRREEMDICKNLPKLWGLSWISLYANWEASFISSFCQEWRENLQSSDVLRCLLLTFDHRQAVWGSGREWEEVWGSVRECEGVGGSGREWEGVGGRVESPSNSIRLFDTTQWVENIHFPFIPWGGSFIQCTVRNKDTFYHPWSTTYFIFRRKLQNKIKLKWNSKG